MNSLKIIRNYLAIVMGFVIVSSGGMFLGIRAYEMLYVEESTGPSNNFYEKEDDDKKIEDEDEEKSGFLKAPKKTNFVLLGVDENEYLTDVIMVGSFDRDSQVIDIISIPRDTYTEFSSEEKAKLNKIGIYPPDMMKYNAVHSYTKDALGTEFMIEHITDNFGIKIDYYAKVNLKGFRDIVDAIGGVEFDVPVDMVYSDPLQNLYINVPKGKRVLTGKEAEGVVRYRSGYVGGDLKRLEVQQDFMVAMFKKLLSFETIITKPMEILRIIISNVETNFKLTDAPKYVEYLPKLSLDKFNTHTMPIDEDKLTQSTYVIPDKDKLTKLVNEIFYGDRLFTIEGKDAVYNKEIEVLNGSKINGLAGKTKEKLTELGFNVTSYGTYQDDGEGFMNETRIKVKAGINIEELEKHFENPSVEYTLKKSDLYDIQIIIGLDGKVIE